MVDKRSDAQAMFRCDNYPDRDINDSNLHLFTIKDAIKRNDDEDKSNKYILYLHIAKCPI